MKYKYFQRVLKDGNGFNSRRLHNSKNPAKASTDVIAGFSFALIT